MCEVCDQLREWLVKVEDMYSSNYAMTKDRQDLGLSDMATITIHKLTELEEKCSAGEKA